jgi:hypothetical protein
MEAEGAETVTEVIVFPTIAMAAEAETDAPVVCATVAVIVTLPDPTPVTSPVLLTDATFWFELLQVATLVTFPVAPLP